MISGASDLRSSRGFRLIEKRPLFVVAFVTPVALAVNVAFPAAPV